MTSSSPDDGRPSRSTGDHDGQPASTPDCPPDVSERSRSAIRLLELTAIETDRWLVEARSQSAAIVDRARHEAAELVRAARDEAEQITSDARAEARKVRGEASALRKQHDDDVARLQQVATEHREWLRHHFTEMLDRVESRS